MGRRKKPVFRLTLFFISVVIASGTILAYLSINNISNLKELTEKRVLEEQKNLAVTISDHIHETLIDIADQFSSNSKVIQEDYVSGIISQDSFDLVEQPFIMDGDGHFIWPWFVDNVQNLIKKEPSGVFKANLDRAEKAEFIEQNFEKASNHYLTSLQASSNEFDSVQTWNALARLSVKFDDRPRALGYYSTIISKYHSLCDPFGFPYVYYAIPQLIKISNPSNRNNVLQEIGFCLTGMKSGKIPLNFSTQDILEQVSHWIEMELATSEKVDTLKETIQSVSNRMSFLDRNEGMIREYLQGNIRDERSLIKDKYNVLNGIEQDRGELILMNLEGDTASGFTIVFERLWDRVLDQNLIQDSEFEYELELMGVANGMTIPEDQLTTTSEITPYFPEHQLMIRLKNENLIDEFVRRRSWIYGIALSLLLGGMVLGILLIMRDISREEHLAQLRADFISNVTHELKTPLTSIQLFTESIALHRINSATQKKEYLQIILKETESLKRMINNILDFSRKEKGKRDYNFEQVNVTLLLNDAINDLDYWLKQKGFSMVKEIEENVIAMADPVALKQAIINLLNNAIKFSVNRKEIEVRLIKEREMIMIQVEDKGIGIPDDQKEKIFQAFYRVGQKNSEDISGTGLGLSVVKEIVEAHHGTIMVDSKLNEGSTFTIQMNTTQENQG